MSTEQQKSILIGAREGLQTPSCLPGGKDWILSPDLPPPCQIVVQEMVDLFGIMQERPDILTELQNSISSPTAALTNQELLGKALELGVIDRVAVHTRMKEEDFLVAVACGAKRIHLFGDSSEVAAANGNRRDIASWIGELDRIAALGVENDIHHIRASLEHTTDTKPEKIVEFVRGIKTINQKHQNIITGLGIPDTNGCATPEDYESLLNLLLPEISDSGLTIFVHLHDDNGRAEENAERIFQYAQSHNLKVVIETADPNFPGERVGIRPTHDMVYSTLAGSSWVKTEEDLSDPVKRDLALQIHVAGVHTAAIGKYTNGYESYIQPGLYGIQGTSNNEVLLRRLGFDIDKIRDKEFLKASALVAREIAAQYGNLPQAYAIGFVRYAYCHQQEIINMAQSFGSPLKWVSPNEKKQPPDIRNLKETIDKQVNDLYEEIRLAHYDE